MDYPAWSGDSVRLAACVLLRTGVNRRMFARLPRSLALLVVALFLAAAAWCLMTPPGQVSHAAPGHYTDMMLYRDIVSQLQSGHGYYPAATETQRAHHYPTIPFVTVREPTLYWLAAQFGWTWLNRIEIGVLLAAVVAWTFALPKPINLAEKLAAAALIAVGGLAPIATSITAMSEAWCGLLLTLALGLWLWPRARWWMPVLVIAAALALRELALPFALLAAAFALWERRWNELAAWAAVIVLFGLGMALHAARVAEFVRPTDYLSPGWAGGLGLRAVLLAVVNTTVLHLVPHRLALVIALLPVLGWGALDRRGGRFAVLLLGGYALMIALFSRSDNFYWGFLLLPAWLAGLALVPRGFWQLARAITQPAVPATIPPAR